MRYGILLDGTLADSQSAAGRLVDGRYHARHFIPCLQQALERRDSELRGTHVDDADLAATPAEEVEEAVEALGRPFSDAAEELLVRIEVEERRVLGRLAGEEDADR